MMENKNSKNVETENDIQEILEQDIIKARGLEYLTEKTLEWEHVLLRAIQIAPIEAGLDNLEVQGLIKKHSNKKCFYDYDLTESGKYSLEEYQKIPRLK